MSLAKGREGALNDEAKPGDLPVTKPCGLREIGWFSYMQNFYVLPWPWEDFLFRREVIFYHGK